MAEAHGSMQKWAARVLCARYAKVELSVAHQPGVAVRERIERDSLDVGCTQHRGVGVHLLHYLPGLQIKPNDADGKHPV